MRTWLVEEVRGIDTALDRTKFRHSNVMFRIHSLFPSLFSPPWFSPSTSSYCVCWTCFMWVDSLPTMRCTSTFTRLGTPMERELFSPNVPKWILVNILIGFSWFTNINERLRLRLLQQCFKPFYPKQCGDTCLSAFFLFCQLYPMNLFCGYVTK